MAAGFLKGTTLSAWVRREPDAAGAFKDNSTDLRCLAAQPPT